jgi:glycosyltransferase involved in cell wall biosynthesis
MNMIKNLPFVSVVIPTYNRRQMLEKCLLTLFKQTYPNKSYEILVIDNGFIDGSKELIEELRNISPVSLKYIIQKKKGAANARNMGILEARGEIIAFTDDDCIVDKGWLENLVSFFKDSEIIGVQGKVMMIGEKTPFINIVENFHGNGYITANIAYKKDALLEVNMFNEELLYCEDEDLAYRILKMKGEINFSEKALVMHPTFELNIKQYFKKKTLNLKYTMQLYRLHPEHYIPIRGSLNSFFIFMIFLRPAGFLFSSRRYFMKHPQQIPKFIVTRMLDSFYTFYLLNCYIFNKYIK